MMGGGRGHGGPMNLMAQEALKPKNTRVTLQRFGGYFKPFWPMLALALVLVVISTWTQVTGPELLGQAVDCYLTPAQASSGFANLPGASTPASTPAATSSCWFETADKTTLTNEAKLAGLGNIVLRLIGLYLLGAVTTGLTFFSMSWSGQHVLKSMRTAVFNHMHRLSLSYYAENEAGNLMSRITNDSSTMGAAASHSSCAGERGQRRAAAAGVDRLQHADQERALCAD